MTRDMRVSSLQLMQQLRAREIAPLKGSRGKREAKRATEENA